VWGGVLVVAGPPEQVVVLRGSGPVVDVQGVEEMAIVVVTDMPRGVGWRWNSVVNLGAIACGIGWKVNVLFLRGDTHAGG
jgi:hypothetical protein